MAHQHLQPERIDAEAHHGGRVAVAQDVRRQVRQAEPGAPQLEDPRHEPALAVADERGLGRLACQQTLDRGPQGAGHRLVAIVGLPVDEQGPRVPVGAPVAHAKARDFGQAQAGEEQQQHDVGVQTCLGHAGGEDLVDDAQHGVARERLEPRPAEARGLDAVERVSVQQPLADGPAEQSAGDLQFLAVDRLRRDLPLTLQHVEADLARGDLVERRRCAPLPAEDREVLPVVGERVVAQAGGAHRIEQAGRGLLQRDDGGAVAVLFADVEEAGDVGRRLLWRAEGRAVVAPTVDAKNGSEAAGAVSAHVRREPRGLGWHGRRVPCEGANMQQNERESSNGPHGTGCGAGRGTPARRSSAGRLLIAQLTCGRQVADRAGLAALLRDERERARVMSAVGARKGAVPHAVEIVAMGLILACAAACAMGVWPWPLPAGGVA